MDYQESARTLLGEISSAEIVYINTMQQALDRKKSYSDENDLMEFHKQATGVMMKEVRC